MARGAQETFEVDFNPRTHRGVRPDQMGNVFYFPKFQSTHPSWGATEVGYDDGAYHKISIHAPIVGCDFLARLSLNGVGGISIHAPIVGCDRYLCVQLGLKIKFQSTHPSWGAT